MYILFATFPILVRLQRANQYFFSLNTQTNTFQMYANIIGLEVGKVQFLMNRAIYSLFIPMFWVAVGLVCIVVKKSPSDISYSLYIACSGALCFVLLGLVGIPPQVFKQLDNYKFAVKQNLHLARRLYFAKKTNISLCNLKLSRSNFSDITLRCFDVIFLSNDSSWTKVYITANLKLHEKIL